MITFGISTIFVGIDREIMLLTEKSASLVLENLTLELNVLVLLSLAS